ncbi:hypothetical protein D9M68_723980 [compost metagenome]
MQPEAIELAAHRGAVSGQAQRIAFGAGHTFDLAVWVEPDQAAFAQALFDLPGATQVGAVQRLLEAGAGRGVSCDGRRRTHETLLGPGVTGRLHQLGAVQAEVFVVIAVEVDAHAFGVFAHQLALAQFEAVAEAGEPPLAVELPFQVGAIGEQGFAQVVALGGGIDRRLVDPDAAGVVGCAGAAAEQPCAEQQDDNRAHGRLLGSEGAG